MAKRKPQSEKRARIILALLGTVLLLWNVNIIGLYLLGDVAPAYDIVLSRLGTRGDSDIDTAYRFNASYKYVVDGVEYDGLDTGLRGPRLGPKYDNTVHYYPFAPRISSLFAESATSGRMLLTCGFPLILILLAVIPRKRSGQRKRRKSCTGFGEHAIITGCMSGGIRAWALYGNGSKRRFGCRRNGMRRRAIR